MCTYNTISSSPFDKVRKLDGLVIFRPPDKNAKLKNDNFLISQPKHTETVLLSTHNIY